MRTGLNAFTVRRPPTSTAAPLLALIGLSVIASLCWLLANPRGPQFQLMAGTLCTALVAVSFVIVRMERQATQLGAALVGLPEPRGGWTPTEQRTIDGVSRDGVDVAVLFGDGQLVDYVGVTMVLIIGELPLLAVLGTVSPMPFVAFIVVLGLSAVATAALTYAWRADVHLREHLVPLADRVADTQMALLVEAA